MIDREDYKQRGYALVRGLFAAEEVEAVRSAACEVFRLQMEHRGLVGAGPLDEAEFEAALYRFFAADLPGFISCSYQVQHILPFNRLSTDPRLVAVLQELGLGLPNFSTRPQMLFNSRQLAAHERYWRYPVHQDWRNMQGSLDSVVAWLPLIDVDPSIGALELLPGSHTLGLLKAEMTDGYPEVHGPYEDSDFVPCDMKRGDALIFSAFLIHRSGTNTTDRIRWSIQLRYNNLEEKTFAERGFPHGYIYKPVPEIITEGFPTPEQLREAFR